MESNNSIWEYDQIHPEGFNTLKGDKDLKLPESDVPVPEQRIRSQTNHKNEPSEVMVSLTPEDAGQNPESVLQRRRSSASFKSRRRSRKATGSYGDNDLKPLSSLSTFDKEQALDSSSNPLYFAEGLPSTTSGV